MQGGSDPYMVYFTNPPEVLGPRSHAPISKIKKATTARKLKREEERRHPAQGGISGLHSAASCSVGAVTEAISSVSDGLTSLLDGEKPAPTPTEGHVVNFLAKNPELNKSFAFDSPGATRKEAELKYRVVGATDQYTFVEVQPKTGRHHQIRVTLASLGSPIKGDIKYGSRRTNDNASIHLHARQIDFIHPVRREAMTILAPPPADVLWDEWVRQEQGR